VGHQEQNAVFALFYIKIIKYLYLKRYKFIKKITKTVVKSYNLRYNLIDIKIL